MFGTTTTTNLNSNITMGKRHFVRLLIINITETVKNHCNKNPTTLEFLWPFPFQEIFLTIKIHASGSYCWNIQHIYVCLQFYPT